MGFVFLSVDLFTAAAGQADEDVVTLLFRPARAAARSTTYSVTISSHTPVDDLWIDFCQISTSTLALRGTLRKSTRRCTAA